MQSRLLMDGEICILNKSIITEPHKRPACMAGKWSPDQTSSS